MTNAPVMRMFLLAVVALMTLVRADAQVCQCVLEDATPPVLQLPPNQTQEATGPGGAVVTFSVSASDNVDDDVWVRCSPESWSTFVLGTTTVNCTATDHMKNTAAGSFTVTVVPVSDTTPPVLSSPPVFKSLTASPNTLWPVNHQMVSVKLTARVTDDDDPAPVTRIIGVTSNEAQTGLWTGDIGPDWSITGTLTVRLRAERASKGPGRVYTVTVESRDASGNASVRTVTVKAPLRR